MKRLILAIAFSAAAAAAADFTETTNVVRKIDWVLTSATSVMVGDQVSQVVVYVARVVDLDGAVEKVENFNDTWTRQQLLDAGFKSPNGLRVMLDLDAAGKEGFRSAAISRVKVAWEKQKEAERAAREAARTNSVTSAELRWTPAITDWSGVVQPVANPENIRKILKLIKTDAEIVQN